MALSKQDLSRLAKVGAQARLEELARERELILKAFPELGHLGPTTSARPKRRARRRMTANQRKAIGERMKKYWESRRKGLTKK